MKALIITFSFISLTVTGISQDSLDIHNIPGTDTSVINKYNHNISGFRLPSISKSQNILEIRLYDWGMIGSRCRILSFDKNRWEAKEIKYPSLSDDSVRYSKSSLNFKAILDSLIQDNIFNLPNQSALNLNGTVYDGVNYFLIYKVYNKFRCYEFSNPNSYIEMNEAVKELKDYSKIVKIFNSFFE